MKSLLLTIFSISILNISAQIDGANVFGTDQVVRIDLNFNQVSFWDSLVNNYSSGTDMICNEMIIVDNTGTHIYSSVNIRLKGNSSYGHPGNKKSFKVDFNDNIPGQNYDGLKKLNFNNGFKDPTFMREKLFFDMCHVIDVPAPRVNYANVYMNGQFWGFYGMVENVDDQFLDWAILEDSGNLFKAGDNFGGSNLPADLKYYGTDPASYYGRYELNTNELANNWTDLIALIDYINNSSSTDFTTQFASRINKTPYLRSLAMDILFSNLDSYVNSARNYYLYHNMNSNLWEWIKWDANEAFGLYSGGPGLGNLEQLAPNYVATNRPLIQNVFNSPELYQEYLLELCWIKSLYFNSSYFDTKADDLKTLIAPHVYADYNKMYSDAYFDQNIESNITVTGGMGTQTVYGLKSFVQNRYNYLNGLIDCSLGLDEEYQAEFVVFPNPFDNEFKIKAEGVKNVKLLDIQGREVALTTKVDGSEMIIHPMENASGYYFLVIEFNNGTASTKKIIKK